MTSHAPADVWRTFGADAAVCSELSRYAASRFAGETEVPSFPLPDESFVHSWSDYVREGDREGTAAVLSRVLIQLAFPVAAGMSDNVEYVSATRRGDIPASAAPRPKWTNARGLQLRLHPTAAGAIPIIITRARADFELLIRALTLRNEPVRLPASMGACIIGGYNNWDRIRRWRARNPHAASTIPADKREFQDRFIVLSSGPYSGVPASAVGVDPATWDDLSLHIRLEHECAHYFTRRVFGAMTNSLLDELIADFAGIVAATGRYRAAWGRCFLGVDRPTEFRAGGRLENYRGSPPLSEEAFAVLQRAVVVATNCLQQFDIERRSSSPADDDPLATHAHLVMAIARVGLEGLLSPLSPTLLLSQFKVLSRRCRSPAAVHGRAAISEASREKPRTERSRV